MKKNQSYRQKENRKDKRLALGALVVLFALALGLRWYSDTHQPPVHPLKITIIERGIPKTPLHSISETYLASGELVANDNMKELAQGRYVEGGETTWELLDVQQRTTPDGAWTPPPIPDKEKLPPLPIDLREKNAKYPYWQLNAFATHAGEWKITVRASRRYYDPDSKEEWVGSDQHTITRILKEDPHNAKREAALKRSKAMGLPEPTELPPPGSHPLEPNKKYVAKLQWSSGHDKWQDVPRKGQRGYPLAIPSDTTVGFRAVKTRPNEPWPDWTGDPFDFNSILNWSGTIVPASGLGGSAIWVMASEQQAVSQDANDLKTIAVTCGNTVKNEVLVVPPLDMELKAQFVNAVSKQTKNYHVRLQCVVQWQGDGWQPPTKILFQAFKAPLTAVSPAVGRKPVTTATATPTPRPLKPIGRINGPSPQDDVVKAGADGIARAMLTVPQGAGRVSLRAVFLSPTGNEVWPSVEFIQVP